MTLADATALLHASRNGRSSRQDCERDAATALGLVADPGRSYVTAVRIAGVKVARPAR